MSSQTEIATKHPARNRNGEGQKTITTVDSSSSGTLVLAGTTTMGCGRRVLPHISVPTSRREAILEAPMMIKAGDQKTKPAARSPCKSGLRPGNNASVSASPVHKHDGFNFAEVAFSPPVTKQTRPPRKMKSNRSMKQQPHQEQSRKPKVTEANRPEEDCGTLRAVGNPLTAKRRVTFKDELVEVVVAKNLTQNPKRKCLHVPTVDANDASLTEEHVLKRNNISRASGLSPIKDQMCDDGEGVRPARDTSTKTTVDASTDVRRAGIHKPLLTERLNQGKENDGQSDEVIAEYFQDETITHPEPERSSSRDEQRKVCTVTNAEQLTMTSERSPHDRCGLRHGVGHPRICKVTPPGEESIDTKHCNLITTQHTSVARTTEEPRHETDFLPEEDDDQVLVIDETRCKASGNDDKSVARRATAEDTVGLQGRISSVDGTKGSLSTTQHQTTLTGEVVLPAGLSRKDDVQDNNQTDTECEPPSYPLCNNPGSRQSSPFETKSQEVKGKNGYNQTSDKVAVLPVTSAFCFTKSSLVLCGGRSSSYSTPESLPTKQAGGSGGISRYVPASTPADTPSKQARPMAAHLQTGTAKSASTDPLLMTPQAQNSSPTGSNGELSLPESRAQRVHGCTFPLFDIKDGGQCKGSIHSSAGMRYPPQSQNTIQEHLILEQSVQTKKLLAPSYFKSSRAPEQNLTSFISHVNQTSSPPSVPNTKTTSPSVQILANTNFRGPHYMVLTRKVATAQQGAHQSQFTRPQIASLRPQLVPPKACALYQAPHTSTAGGPAQYKQTTVQSTYPGGQGSFGISGPSSQQRSKKSQPWHQMNPQVVRLTRPSVQTSSQLIRPAVFAAPAPTDPLRMTSQTRTAPTPRSKDDLPLAVHACTFPFVDLGNGGQCNESTAYHNQTAPAMPTTQTQPSQWTQQTGWSSKTKPPFPRRTSPPSLQEIQPPPPPPQAGQLPHQVRIMKYPSGTIMKEPNVTLNGKQARVTPSSFNIPNGTLFVQTPQGLAQIQQYGQMNRPLTGCQQQIAATRNTTRESVDRPNSFGRQNQGSPVTEGQRPSVAAVATTTPASNVQMKSDELTGVRLPYPMPTQKQLLFLLRKTETQNPPKTRNDAQPSNRRGTAGINSHTEKDTGSTGTSIGSDQNWSEINTEEANKKSTRTTTNETTTNGVTSGSIERTTHSKILAASETNEDGNKDNHNTSSGNEHLRGAAWETKTRVETKASQLDDSEQQQQHSKSVSGLPRSSYEKFLDSSVTVKCMYLPKALPVLRVNEDRETGGEGSKDPCPSETLLDDKELDVTTSGGCKEEETLVTFSVKSAPLSNVPGLEDEAKVQDVRSTERQRRGGNTKSSVKYTEAESGDDKDDETWHPGAGKSPSRYTRRFRKPRTGSLSKINTNTSTTELSGQPLAGTLRSPTTEEDTKKGHLQAETEMKSGSKTTCVLKLNHGGYDSERGVEIIDKLGHPDVSGVSKDIFESEVNGDESSPSSTSSSGSSTTAERKTGASQTKSKIRTIPRTPEKRINSNSNKREKQARKTAIPGTPNVKTQTGSNANSPSKRTHQRSSQSRSSDSDNLSSKYPKKIGSKKGHKKPAPNTATCPPIGQLRASLRRLPGGHPKQSPAPLWQRVLKMLGLRKKKPARSPPSGAKVWHKRRSSSVVLAESLAESARRLEKIKDERNEDRETCAETDGRPLKKKGTEMNRSLTEDKQRHEGDQSGSKKSSKKKKKTQSKKHHKRRKIVKAAKVSPVSTTDPASGSLTSIDFDSRRQTRSRTRPDSDSLSSLADSASSASPSARRGRRTLASISARTWEDCYRCTYLKWKETNESPETLTNDEEFKVMTNELATPSRTGPSKEKKCFQKLLMSKWEDIVQTAQTGTVEEKMAPKVEGWPFEITSCSYVETPPVASELSVCTTDYFRDASTLSQQEDWSVYRDDTDTIVSSQIDIKSEELYSDVVESYGCPPVLSPIQDYSEVKDAQGIKHHSQDTPPFFIPQTLTEETLQLLAESGSIDPDLNGLQAFALFMPDSGGTDHYGDPSSTSPPPQPVLDSDEDVPPVISCHKLNTDDVIIEEGTVDVEEVEENTNQSRSNLFCIPVPLTKETESQEYVNELLELSGGPHPGTTDTEELGDSFHNNAETGNNSDHSNEEEGEILERVLLRKMESSLEEGEIIDESGFSDYKT